MEKLNGHIVINGKGKVYYVKEDDSVDIAVRRRLRGKEFMLIDLSKVDNNAIRYIKKNWNKQAINPENYTFELIGDYWQVKDIDNKIVAQLKNSGCIKDCYFKYYGDDMFIAFENLYKEVSQENNDETGDVIEDYVLGTKFRLVNKDGEIISPPKEYYSMKPILNTDTILCSYVLKSPLTYSGELEVFEIIDKQGKILFENLLIFTPFDSDVYQDFCNYEELPFYYLDMTEDNIKKFEDATWNFEEFNIIDNELLKAAECTKNL